MIRIGFIVSLFVVASSIQCMAEDASRFVWIGKSTTFTEASP